MLRFDRLTTPSRVEGQLREVRWEVYLRLEFTAGRSEGRGTVLQSGR